MKAESTGGTLGTPGVRTPGVRKRKPKDWVATFPDGSDQVVRGHWTKGEARAALKKRLKLPRLPAGTVLCPIEFPPSASAAG